jgi:hypothetical protein
MPNPKLTDEQSEIDQIALRWARETRNPTGALDYGPSTIAILIAMKDGAVLGGKAAPMADDVLRFDQVLASKAIKPRTRITIVVWYCGPMDEPVYLKAQKLGVARTYVYEKWREALDEVYTAMNAEILSAA